VDHYKSYCLLDSFIRSYCNVCLWRCTLWIMHIHANIIIMYFYT